MAKRDKAKAEAPVEEPGGGLGGLAAALAAAGLARERASTPQTPVNRSTVARAQPPDATPRSGSGAGGGPTGASSTAKSGMAQAGAPTSGGGPKVTSGGPKTSSGGGPKVVVRMERAGRGGHTATVVEGVAAAEREEVARALRKGLGAGAAVDGARIVVQGDLVERVATVLEARGLPRVVRGN